MRASFDSFSIHTVSTKRQNPLQRQPKPIGVAEFTKLQKSFCNESGQTSIIHPHHLLNKMCVRIIWEFFPSDQGFRQTHTRQGAEFGECHLENVD